MFFFSLTNNQKKTECGVRLRRPRSLWAWLHAVDAGEEKDFVETTASAAAAAAAAALSWQLELEAGKLEAGKLEAGKLETENSCARSSDNDRRERQQRLAQTAHAALSTPGTECSTDKS
jgi:hypothetical protein